MAKQFIRLRKAAPSLCMSMKISPSVPSLVLAGAEVDLVAADARPSACSRPRRSGSRRRLAR